MQFSILAVAAFAAAAVASPVLEERTTPAQKASQQCGNNQKLSCCDSLQKGSGGLINVLLGINCTPINVLSLLPLSNICTTQVACCQSGTQTGLVNVGNVCSPIQL